MSGGKNMINDNDNCRITRRAYNTSSSKSLTEVVVEAIADQKGIGELDPNFLLYERVDIESLDGLLNSKSPKGLQIQFKCVNQSIRVRQEGETEFSITVTDAESEGEQ